MQGEMMILRLLHILTGVFWAGTVFYISLFVLPAAKATGDAGKRFMEQLNLRRGLPMTMTLAAILNIVTGLRMIMILSNKFEAKWFESKYGATITMGAVLALITFILDVSVGKPVVKKMGEIGDAADASGTAPTAEQKADLARMWRTYTALMKAMAWLLAITVASMSIAENM